MSVSKLRGDIEIVQKALNVVSEEPKTRLDFEAMTDQEQFIVKGATALTRAAMRRAIKEQNVNSLSDVDLSKIPIIEEDRSIFEAYAIIERKYLVSEKEYWRRHPIH